MAEFRMFLDESGDHSLNPIDVNFPVFCLTGCIFEKNYYHEVARGKIDEFKMLFWGRTDVILHSHEIRKRKGDFSILNDPHIRTGFYEKLNELISGLDFRILACVILKNDHKAKYGNPINPYYLSLNFLMERFCMFMRKEDGFCRGFITAESRGKQEDDLLITEYQRLRNSGNQYLDSMSNITGLTMQKKIENIAGLQIADLAAYPIASKVLRPDTVNQSFEILEKKIETAPPQKGRVILGYGLKIFPMPLADHIRLWVHK